MRKIHLFFLFLVVLPLGLSAQPPVEWIRSFDNMNRREEYHDVYAVSDGGYIMCGSSSDGYTVRTYDTFITRIDENGGRMWSNAYPIVDDRDVPYSIIETDDEDFIAVGGITQMGEPLVDLQMVMKIAGNGNMLWRRTYQMGGEQAVIELKGGNYLVAGSRSLEQGWCAHLMAIDGDDGDMLWNRDYHAPGDNSESFFAMRETFGGIVLMGRVANRQWLVKIDLERNGEVVWDRVDRFQNGITIPFGLVSCDDGGFVTAGYTAGNVSYLFKINSDGDEEWLRLFDMAENERTERFTGVDRVHDGGFILVGHATFDNLWLPMALRTTPNGIERWRSYYNLDAMPDYGTRNTLNGVIRGHGSAIIACGQVESEINNTGGDGLVMKIEPGDLQPALFYFTPRDTILYALPNDTIRFVVRARDQMGNELNHLWIFNQIDTLGIDTSETCSFDEMETYTVQCQLSNVEFSTAITWHVTVTDLYIASHTPDSTAFSIRRGSSLDFALNYRATDDGPVIIDWYKSDEGDGFPVSHEPNTTLTFDRPGDVVVSGVAYRGESEDMVEWNISVRSVVSVFRPQLRNITAYMDTTITFSVEPFNPESPELRYEWLVDGENISEDQSVLIDFNEPREYSVIAYIYDGVEGDTLVWNVTISPDLADPWSLAPDTYALSTYPNPFNSSTTITYSLPVSSDITLSVFDLSGRQVAQLVSGNVDAGNHSVVWDAQKVATGLYFVKLNSVTSSATTRVVLIH